MAQAKRDQNSIPTLLGVSNADSSTPIAVEADPTTKRLLVNATITGGAGDGSILDGVDTGIKATVKDFTNSNPLTVHVVDTNGDAASLGGGTQYTEDAAAAANPVGTVPILVRKDTPAGEVSTDGDNVAQRGTNYGAAYVTLLDTSGNPVSVGGGTQYTEDAAAAADPVGTALNLVRADTPAAVTSTDGDNVAARGTNKGELYVKHLDAIPVTDNSGNLSIDDGGNSITVDNAGTFAVQVDGNALTSLQLADDVVYADDADWTDNTSKHTLVGGVYQSAPHTVTDGDVTPFLTDVNGRLVVAAVQSGTWDEVGINDSGNSITVDGTVAVTGVSTLAEQQTQTTHLATIAGDTTDIETAVELIDDTVATLGTTTYTETTTKGLIIGAVRRDADTTLVDTTNEVGPLQMDANGRLKVEVFDSGDSHTVDNGGTFAVQESGSALTALQLIDDVVYTDDTSTHSTGSSKGALIMAAATPTDAAVNANDIGAVAMTVNRELHVSLTTALPAGTNGIGKLTANSGVDIGDVDVTSVIPGTGTTNLGKAEDAGHTTGDTGIYNLGVRNDTPNTALTNTDADYASITTDRVGGIRTALYETDFAVLGTNHVKKYYTNAGAVTDGIVWSPAAGKRWYVTDITINVSAAATVTLEDDLAAGDSAVAKFEFAANSGWSHSYHTPLFSGEDAADLLVTTSAGNVYITITGYEI